MQKRITQLILSACCATPLVAQENQGSIHDNYNPVNGQYINPSNIVDAKPWLDINLIGADAYLRNNYAFFPNTTLLKFSSFQTEPSVNNSVSKISGYADLQLRGPSASIVLGEHAVSLFTNVRGMVNVKNVPGVLGKMATENGMTYADTGLYKVNDARVKSMAWGEVGLTYGKILKVKGDQMLTGAISVKRLFGIQNAAILVDDANVDVYDVGSATLNSTDSKYSYAAPSFNAGRGWGTNLGVTYKKMKRDVTHYVPHSRASGCEQVNYKYKIGFSLMDVGYIRFNQGAYYGTYNENTIVEDINSAQDVSDESQAIQEGTKFTTSLPTAASVQFDYNVNDKVYLNATAVQHVRMANTYGVERADLLSVSARYETKFFGVGLPLTVQNYDYKTTQVGLALRLANFTIGSDNILPYFIKHDIVAADIYFSLKLTIFKSPACKDRKRGNSGRRGAVDCPKWNF